MVNRNYNTMNMNTPQVSSPASMARGRTITGTWCQVLSTVSVGILCASVGSCLAWPSSVLETLTNPSGPWSLTGDESSWVVSLLDLGVVIGSLPAGYLADRHGRRTTMIASTVPLLASWALILVATSASPGDTALYILCGARLAAGRSSSAILVSSVMYISEISSDHLRGTLNTVGAASLNAGLLFSYAIGPYVSLQALSMISLFLPVFALIAVCWIPESPWYLIKKLHRNEAMGALERLRGGGIVDTNKELRDIQAAIVMEDSSPKWNQLLEGDRKALVIVLNLVVMQSLSGAAAVQSYSSITLPSTVGPYEVIIMYGVLTLLASLAAAFVVDCVGRKPLLFWATLGQTLALVGSATYYTLSKGGNLTSWGWVPAVGLLVFGVAYPMGLGAVPNVLQSEMFSSSAKGLCLPIVLMTFNVLTFFVSKMFEVVSRKLGHDVAFWFFALDAIVATLFACFVLRETKGKSLEEIQRDLNSNRGETVERSRGRDIGRAVLESEPSRATLYSISIESTTGSDK